MPTPAPAVGASVQAVAPPSGAPASDMVFHHVGCAVREMDAALRYYTGVLGLRQVSEPIAVAAQRVRVCFLELAPGAHLELVEGLEPGSPVEALLQRAGPGPYHLCFQTSDLDAAVRRLRRAGFFPLHRFEWSGRGMRRFAFLLAPDRQLIELCEPERETP